MKQWLRAVQRWPPRGRIRFGGLRRTTPISRVFGFDRGQPVDRFYIEQFLSAHAGDIRGRVLEIGGDEYTGQFGADRVTTRDVLHVEKGHAGTTIVADLADAGSLPPDVFDCIICTQTLQHIYRVRDAVAALHRGLKPGGVLLATVPGISQISRFDSERWGDYWRFTTQSVRRLCEEVFVPANVSVEAQGNVFTAIAFLHGLATEDVRREELSHRDADYEVVIAVRAIK